VARIYETIFANTRDGALRAAGRVLYGTWFDVLRFWTVNTFRMRRSREFSRRELLRMTGAALAIGATGWKTPSRANSVKFADVAERAGISFLHDNAASAQKYRSEEHTSELQSPDHLVCR